MPSNSTMVVCRTCCTMNIDRDTDRPFLRNNLKTSFVYTQADRENVEGKPNGISFDGSTGEPIHSTRVQNILAAKGQYLHEATRSTSHNQGLLAMDKPREMDSDFIGANVIANEKNDQKPIKSSSKVFAKHIRRFVGGTTAPMFDERSRVNDMQKRVTTAARVMLNAARYSAGVDERSTIEQLREGKDVTPSFEGIDDSKRKFVRDFVKTDLGAVDGTKFAYVRGTHHYARWSHAKSLHLSARRYQGR